MKNCNIFSLLALVPYLLTQSLAVKAQSSAHLQPDIAGIEKLVYARNKTAKEYGTAGYTAATSNYRVHFYRCNWELNPEIKYINGAITAGIVTREAADSIAFDLSKTLTVDSVVYHHNKIQFRQTEEQALVIKWPSTVPANQKDSVTIYYQGVPGVYGLGDFFQGFHRGSYAIWTLSEPYSAAGWWPCKNTLTDKADAIDINVTVPELYTVSSNGVLSAQYTANGKTTSMFRHRYPIATYLVALAITQYALQKDSVLLGGRQMPVNMYSFTFDVDYYKPATEQAKQCLLSFSNLFGMYPFQKEHYTQTQWGLGGGMEHQTNSYIADNWPNLVAHELGHQWFGDKVTCASWQDLWLNEGFATYTELLYFEQFDPPTFNVFLDNKLRSVTNAPGGSVWVNDTTNMDRLFSSRLTYNKGGLVVRMLRWVLGDSVFYPAVRAYLDDPSLRYSFARTADLKRVLQQQSGKSLENFFNKWIYGEGYPSYQLSWNQNLNNWVNFRLNQTTSHNSVSFYDMPVAIRFKNAQRDTTIVVNNLYSGQEFNIGIGFKADTVLIDPQKWLISKNNTTTKETVAQVINQVLVYPNPSPEAVNISIDNPTDKKLLLQLFNDQGQLLYNKEQNLSGGNETFTIPVRQLARGIYFLRIKGNKDIRLTRKVLR